VVSPWGETLSELPQDIGVIQTSVNIEARQAIKQNMPVAEHNRFRSHFV
jgi:hypothetical protein